MTIQDARVNMFYDSLKPYGEWVFNNTYGWCWYPDNIDVDWQPYTEGQLDLHRCRLDLRYRRSLRLGHLSLRPNGSTTTTRAGCSTPDTQWAPCWVAWRYSKTHVGWAPLTPDCVWRDDTGLPMGRYNPDTIPLNYYTFCHMKDFAGADLRNHYLLIAKNATYVRRTQYAPGTLRFSNAAVSNELPFHKTLVRAVAGHDFQRAHLVTVDAAQNRGAFWKRAQGIPSRGHAAREGKVPQFIGTRPAAPVERQPLEPQALARFQQNRGRLFAAGPLGRDYRRRRTTSAANSSTNSTRLEDFRPSRNSRSVNSGCSKASRSCQAPPRPPRRKHPLRRRVHVPRAEATRAEAALHPASTERENRRRSRPRRPDPQKRSQNDQRQKDQNQDPNQQA